MTVSLCMTIEIDARHPIRIEPFDPGLHDRAAFSCGNARLDNFLKLTAKKSQKGDFTRVWIAVQAGEKRVLGYYAINAHAIETGDLPDAITKKAPRHDHVAAAYISMFAVNVGVQGTGIGRLLLADTLKRVARISEELGIFAVVLDVLDDGDQDIVEKRTAFYRKFGFTPFPSRPLRMFLPTATIRKLLPPAG